MRALADLHDVDIGMSSHKTPQGKVAVRGKGKGKGKGDSVGIEATSTQEDAEDDGEYRWMLTKAHRCVFHAISAS
jgi:hypothetical protein